jgi:hypothetical protein
MPRQLLFLWSSLHTDKYLACMKTSFILQIAKELSDDVSVKSLLNDNESKVVSMEVQYSCSKLALSRSIVQKETEFRSQTNFTGKMLSHVFTRTSVTTAVNSRLDTQGIKS